MKEKKYTPAIFKVSFKKKEDKVFKDKIKEFWKIAFKFIKQKAFYKKLINNLNLQKSALKKLYLIISNKSKGFKN